MDITQKEIVVGVGDCRSSMDENTIITTYALGSCLGVTAYDSRRKIGGMLHAMLPKSRSNEGEQKRPTMFVDTGMKELLTQLKALGADLNNLEYKIFGAAKVLEADRFFKIGDKNIQAMQMWVVEYGARVLVWEVGGNLNRTIKFELKSGQVKVRMPNQPEFYR
jgi:chemotaxis protein CheD